MKSMRHVKILHVFSNKSKHVCDAKRKLISTPIHQLPHRPKMAMRDLNEKKSAPVSAMREMCKPKTFAELLGSKTDDCAFKKQEQEKEECSSIRRDSESTKKSNINFSTKKGKRNFFKKKY